MHPTVRFAVPFIRCGLVFFGSGILAGLFILGLAGSRPRLPLQSADFSDGVSYHLLLFLNNLSSEIRSIKLPLLT